MVGFGGHLYLLQRGHSSGHVMDVIETLVSSGDTHQFEFFAGWLEETNENHDTVGIICGLAVMVCDEQNGDLSE